MNHSTQFAHRLTVRTPDGRRIKFTAREVYGKLLWSCDTTLEVWQLTRKSAYRHCPAVRLNVCRRSERVSA